MSGTGSLRRDERDCDRSEPVIMRSHKTTKKLDLTLPLLFFFYCCVEQVSYASDGGDRVVPLQLVPDVGTVRHQTLPTLYSAWFAIGNGSTVSA